MSDKFRRATYPRHVRIFHRLLQSAAWRNLSGSAAKVLLTLAALEKGDNNGEFFLSARTGAEMTGLGKNAVNRALHELLEKGFIYCAERGGFSRKTPHAARWGLTWAAGPKGSEHRAPSHAYEKWRPEKKRGPRNRDDAVPETRTVTQNAPVHCPQIGDSEAKEMAQNRQTATVPKSGTHTSYQGISLQSAAQHHPRLPSVAWWQPDHSLSLAQLAYTTILAGFLSRAITEKRLAA
ncbi:helix-turn-helix domain-containing protein [Sphingopyxis witflariensis]|uniref:helix-turn-helix domain-containing protein n=1 Tax=Sphingopyxis witflariensis TaxID=173675 RepID=UPI001181C187|nr:helix-turn-helix domain-containing protein [Sphingopyxis witflariensis]